MVIQNQTGKRVRVWRHVYRPKDSPERDRWRYWTVCNGSPPPPLAFAGWTYFVVEDLDDAADATRIAYFDVGWRFLSYDRNVTIRIRPDFFDRPQVAESFQVDELP